MILVRRRLGELRRRHRLTMLLRWDLPKLVQQVEGLLGYLKRFGLVAVLRLEVDLMWAIELPE